LRANIYLARAIFLSKSSMGKSRVFTKNIRGNLMKILYALSAPYFTVPISPYRVRQRLFVCSNGIRMVLRQRQTTRAKVAFALLRFFRALTLLLFLSLSFSLYFCIHAPRRVHRLFRINSETDVLLQSSLRFIEFATFAGLRRSRLALAEYYTRVRILRLRALIQ